ncbi:MAG: hypothetical protein KGP14_04020 [Betaproteobacteria bacterium]|nr:hypothetical protein [Betaproteobacteria bacterium]
MPIARFQMPDGRVARFEVPDGTTPEQAQSMIAASMTSAPSKPRDAYADTAAEQSVGQNLLAGIGGGMKSLYLGGKQMLGLDAPGEVDEHRRAMAGLNTTTAGAVGDFAGQAAVALPAAFVPGANTMLGATVLGGAMGALQPTGQNDSRAANVMLGAAGGAGGKYVGDKLVRVLQGSRSANLSGANSTAQATPGTASASSQVSGGATATGTGGGYNFGTVGEDLSAGLNAPQQAIMERGRTMGMQLTPGQASGSRALQQLEAKLESQPMTSGRFNAIKANNQTVLNRAAANAIGETSDTLDSAVLDQARERISSIYKMVADKTPRTIDPDPFINRLAAIDSEVEGMLPPPHSMHGPTRDFGSITDHPLVKRLYAYAEKGQATGEQLQDIASKLGKVANNQMTSAAGDRQLGMALFKVKDMADDLLASGLSGDTAKAFDAARGQYRNLMLLTQRNGVINPSNGNISGNALAGLLQQKDRNGFLFGRNQSPLYDAARFAQAFRPIVGDSGTATRMPLPSPTDFVLSLPFNIATRAYTSSPAVNLAASAENVSRNGVAPNLGGLLAPFLPQTSEAFGGLLGARLSN